MLRRKQVHIKNFSYICKRNILTFQTKSHATDIWLHLKYKYFKGNLS